MDSTVAIDNLLQGNLDAMRDNIEQMLSLKAAESLEERKTSIASSYFGQE